MNLKKKKILAAKALKVGKERIIFVNSRLSEIKEAITKQDMKDLHNEGAILIKPVVGRTKKHVKKRRSVGNIRKRINLRKRKYVIITRKLRRYVSDLVKKGSIKRQDVNYIRKKIKNKEFKSKASFNEFLKTLKK